jgi:hypothetical protein
LHNHCGINCYVLLWWGSALIFFGSCNKEQSNLPPEVSVIKTESGGMQHGSGLHAMSGTTLRIKISVKDDSELSQLECTMTTPIELHSHAIHEVDSIPFLQAANIGQWNAEKFTNLEGRETTETFKFDVPAEVSGVWNVTVAVLDGSGNITYKDEIMVVQNDSIPFIMPVASTPGPNAEGIVELPAHGNLLLEGGILDFNYLQSVTATLNGANGLVWEQTWADDDTWLFDLSQIMIPTPAQAGTYQLTIRAIDRGGWTNWVAGTIKVF